MGNIIFEDLPQWKQCLNDGSKKLCYGIGKILKCIFVGFLSFMIWCGRQTEEFCRRETAATFVIGIIGAVMISSFIFGFVNERSARMYAEMQRDSIAYVLSQKKLIYEPLAERKESNDVIVNTDNE